MSDYCLIDNLRDLANILSTNDGEIDREIFRRDTEDETLERIQ